MLLGFSKTVDLSSVNDFNMCSYSNQQIQHLHHRYSLLAYSYPSYRVYYTNYRLLR